MTKRTKFKLIIYLLLLILGITGLILWSIFNAARGRDYKRLGEIKIIEAEFNSYFNKFNTYQVPDCSPPMLVNYCSGKGERVLAIDTIVDPVNKGNFQYLVSSLSDDNFRVDFSLEMGIGTLAAGNYLLTRQGISK
ncbi:MAG: hypothetical protein WC518_00405 [Patescibacteria group bacterium]